MYMERTVADRRRIQRSVMQRQAYQLETDTAWLIPWDFLVWPQDRWYNLCDVKMYPSERFPLWFIFHGTDAIG
jgi:hypothetical protein